ncbi:MAG: Gfo/Idh/MocA family oxidoreductase [Phyllobacteriaceae bacterium]|nr:Gfo/Idh/MocA family oxidoreductase [Phyllobacteriaceae bacterium]
MTGLNVGLVGAGMVAEFHIEGWRRCPSAHIVGIADPDLSQAAARADQAGVKAFPSLSDMRKACSLDAVDIVAPPIAHAALIGEAVATGLHVLCQKPLAPSFDAARAIVSDLPGSPRVMIHENWRWRAPYRALKAGLRSGAIAMPDRFAFSVESCGLIARDDGTYPALERQAFFASLDRFLVIELLVHHLDVLSFLLGPIAVNGARLCRRCPAVRAEDGAMIHLSAGGVPGVLTGDFCKPGAPERPTDHLVFEGDDRVEVQGWSAKRNRQLLASVDPVEGYLDSYARAIAHFVEALAEDKPFETPASTGVDLLELVETVYAKAGPIDERAHA